MSYTLNNVSTLTNAYLYDFAFNNNSNPITYVSTKGMGSVQTVGPFSGSGRYDIDFTNAPLTRIGSVHLYSAPGSFQFDLETVPSFTTPRSPAVSTTFDENGVVVSESYSPVRLSHRVTNQQSSFDIALNITGGTAGYLTSSSQSGRIISSGSPQYLLRDPSSGAKVAINYVQGADFAQVRFDLNNDNTFETTQTISATIN